MDYKLIITNQAEKLQDNIIRYLLYQLISRQAALHLLNGIEKIYERLEENPFRFPTCQE